MKKTLFILCLTLCLLLIPFNSGAFSTTDAKEPILITEPCYLLLHYASNGIPMPVDTVDIYLVATVSTDFQYTLTAEYAETGLILNGIQSQSEWNTIRNTLESYILAQNKTPTASSTTDETGKVVFEKLIPGLYFVPAMTATIDGFRYYFASTLIALPNLTENGTWNYAVEANPKPDVRPPYSTDLEYSVIKLWKDADGTKRTSSVTVDIIKDGTVVKTVQLSDENHWQYTWYAADDGSTWTVAEQDVPEGYFVTIDRNQTAFTVINTTNDPPDNPDSGETLNIGFLAAIMCISGAAMLLLSFRRKRIA